MNLSASHDFDAPDLVVMVESMPIDAINRLPYGAVRLNRDGLVIFYSAKEAELSGRYNLPTVGLNFFGDVAPCMNNAGFRGRIEAAIASGTLDIEFTHVGDYDDRNRELRVRALSSTDGGVWLFHKR